MKGSVQNVTIFINDVSMDAEWRVQSKTSPSSSVMLLQDTLLSLRGDKTPSGSAGQRFSFSLIHIICYQYGDKWWDDVETKVRLE